MPGFLKEYIVTLRDKSDLDQFYLDMENPGTNSFVPDREVACLHRRPLSRNTHYLLTKKEAEILSEDPRVSSVTLNSKDMGINVSYHSDLTTLNQTATWSRSTTTETDQKNWGLYRSTLSDNISGWGSESGTGNQLATVNLTATGKNVDIIVVDGNIYTDHSEFVGRAVQYDWYANHPEVWPESPANYTYTNYSSENNHATHVAAIAAGDTQGWARESNIYNLRHDQLGINDGEVMPIGYIMDYVRAFHNSKIVNPTTGRKNPTIVNNSWGLSTEVNFTNPIKNESGISRFSKVFYRGSLISAEDLGNTAVDTGFSGVCNATQRLATLSNISNGGNRIVTSSNSVGSCSSIALNLQGSSGLSDQGLPTSSSQFGVDEYDDAYWTVPLPFDINYCGGSYGPSNGDPSLQNIYVGSNGYVTFGAGSTAYFVGAGSPTARKICISSGDRSCQRLWTGTTGTTPNRVFRIRWEGHDAANGGVLNSPSFVWEMNFYESAGSGSGVTTATIDLHIGDNSCYRGEFTFQQLESYGILADQGYAAPIRDASLDADIQDCIDDGIIFVGSAGNGGYKIDVEGGQDYNNYFLDNGEAIYYHRGTSPGSSTDNIVCVGSLDSISSEPKIFSGGGINPSNTGPRVDLYAPGKNIISAIYNNTGNPNGASSTIVNDGSTIIDTSSNATSASRNSGSATVITTNPHGLTTGDLVTIDFGGGNSFNTSMTSIIVTSPTSFTYTNANTDVGLTSVSGTIYSGYLYQKYNGTSMAAAQVTGLLSLALETYPNMNQTSAQQYIINYAKSNKMTDTEGGFGDGTSLQGGPNRIAFYSKERPSSGNVYPKLNCKFRPASGMIYPRHRIFRF